MVHAVSFRLVRGDAHGARFDVVVAMVAELIEVRYPSFRDNRILEGKTATDVATDAVTDTWAAHRFEDVPPEHIVRAALCLAADTLRKRTRREGVIVRFVRWYLASLNRDVVLGAITREQGALAAPSDTV